MEDDLNFSQMEDNINVFKIGRHLKLFKNGKRHKQAGAELCQAQSQLGLGKTLFPDVDIVFVFPVLKNLKSSPVNQ